MANLQRQEMGSSNCDQVDLSHLAALLERDTLLWPRCQMILQAMRQDEIDFLRVAMTLHSAGRHWQIQHASIALLVREKIKGAPYSMKVLTLGLEVLGGQVHMHMVQICKIVKQLESR